MISTFDIFIAFRSSLIKSLNSKQYEKALKSAFILDYIYTNYHINDNMYDDNIEILINELSIRLSSKHHDYIPRDNHFVFCDSLAWDNHGLTLQYLHALISMRANILYLVTSETGYNNCKSIIEELKSYKNAKVLFLQKYCISIKCIEEIIHAIEDYRPVGIFLHSFSILDAIAVKSITSSTKYRINLGDHLFWSGIDSTDYVIEFREYGKQLSMRKRNISSDKLLILPFYPIIDNNDFRGFPPLKPNSVILFSGGATYKIVNEENTFLLLIKSLVEANPSLVVLLATRGDDSIIKQFILKNNISDRVIQIDYRKDISEVMKHSDLYLQTYPIGGGLMTQYAAVCGVPILSLLKVSTLNNIPHGNIESFFSPFTYRTYYDNVDDLLCEAKKLINDKIYRLEVGKLLKKCVISPEQFNKSFQSILYTRKSDNYYDNICAEEKEYTHKTADAYPKEVLHLISFLFSKLKFSLITITPSITFSIFLCVLHDFAFFINKIKKHF